MAWTKAGNIKGPTSSGSSDVSGITALVQGQSYIDVTFPSAQSSASWTFIECRIMNTFDPVPLNIYPGLVTSKSINGFRLSLSGNPDTANYRLLWTIRPPAAEPPGTATTYLLSGPASGAINVPASFTVQVPPGTTLGAGVVLLVTPNDGGGGGTFSPTSVQLTDTAPTRTFTYTPTSYGTKTISTTNDHALTNPLSLSFVCAAKAYTFTGPSAGGVSVPSTPFTVALPASAPIVGSVVITPSDAAPGLGTNAPFNPTSVTLTSASPNATFTYTPNSTGAKSLSVTNNGGLVNPANLTYTVS